MPNEFRASDYMAGVYERIAQALNPSSYFVYKLPRHFDAGAGYGVVHQVGGAIAGASPESSVVNKYLQSWDYPNVFVVGASSFPQIGAFNPTGTVGALSYWTADAIVNKYMRSPGPLV
jgi:gluconate 2-dehydrogenase alpha chain